MQTLPGESWSITNELQRSNFVRALMAEDMPFRAQIVAGKRTLDQNSLSHVFYGQIAKKSREVSAAEARRYCKLHIGVPIMRAESDEFRDGWDKCIKPHLDYESKLAIMDWWPVTSLMDKHQMRSYLDAMVSHYAGKGITLEGLPPIGFEGMPEAQR